MKKICILILFNFNFILNMSAQWAYLEQKTTTDATNIDRGKGLMVSPDNKFLYGTAENLFGSDRGITVWSISPVDGSLTLVQDALLGLKKPGRLRITPDGKFVYVGDITKDDITVFSRNPVTGILTIVFKYAFGGGQAADPEDLSINSTGTFLYVGLRSEVRVYSINTSTGALTLTQTIAGGVAPAPTSSCGSPYVFQPKGLALSPDDAYLYIASRASDSKSIDVFQVTGGGATLSWIENFSATNSICISPSSMAPIDPTEINMHPSGSFFYMAGGSVKLIRKFNRNIGNGRITGMTDTPVTQWNYSIGMTPDGAQEVFNDAYSTLNVYDIGGTGNLTLSQSFAEGVGGVGELTSPRVFAFTSNASNMYVYTKNTITVFRFGTLIPLISLEINSLNLSVQHVSGESLQIKWEGISNKFSTIELEKSINGKDFILLTTLKNDYINQNNYNDEDPYNSINYYRLKLINRNGENQYSNVVSATVNNNIEIYPNPANNMLYIKVKDVSEMCILNTLGEIIMRKKLLGSNNEIDINNISRGIYYVRINSTTTTSIKKLIIEH